MGPKRHLKYRIGISQKRRRAIVIVACLALFCVVFLQFFSLRIVSDASMGGALEQGDCLLIAKRAYATGDVGFGDVILHTSLMTDDGGDAIEL